MKKSILAVALIAMVSMTASAASIKWSSTLLNFKGTDLKNNANVTGYLLYLESGTVLPSYTIDASFTASTIGAVASTLEGSPKNGKVNNNVDFTLGTEGAYGNGDAFTVLVRYYDPTSKETYWNLSSDIQTVSGIAIDGDAYKGPEYAMNNAMGTDPTLTAGGGWVKAMVVPEPATGALALAGLALLFRRKRA